MEKSKPEVPLGQQDWQSGGQPGCKVRENKDDVQKNKTTLREQTGACTCLSQLELQWHQWNAEAGILSCRPLIPEAEGGDLLGSDSRWKTMSEPLLCCGACPSFKKMSSEKNVCAVICDFELCPDIFVVKPNLK